MVEEPMAMSRPYAELGMWGCSAGGPNALSLRGRVESWGQQAPGEWSPRCIITPRTSRGATHGAHGVLLSRPVRSGGPAPP